MPQRSTVVEPTTCTSCGPANFRKLIGEIVLHFRGFQNVNQPTPFVFPQVLVCLDCGLAQFVLGDRKLYDWTAGRRGREVRATWLNTECVTRAETMHMSKVAVTPGGFKERQEDRQICK